jgi:glycosyltransferase involved in cell wall biosynthesis
MRVAIIISQTPPIASGVARIAARMASGLEECGCEVDVFSASELPRVFWGEYRFVNCLPLFRQLLRQGPYDVINIHGPVPTFSDILLLLCYAQRRRLGGAKIVYTHNWDVDISKATSPMSWIYNLLTKIIARPSDIVITSSKAYNEGFSRFIPPEKRRIIPYGLDNCLVCPTIPAKADEFTILYVGQLRPYKGVEVLLKAAKQLNDCKVLVVGDGHCNDKYTRLANKLDLQNVTFKGRVSDEELKQLYSISHVIVLPSVSRLEAFGLVLLEGMGAGCVPVASHLPGVIETVGDCGLTFETGDAASLAKKLTLLKTDPHLLHHLSQKAWAKAKTYSWEGSCKDYLMAYFDVCQDASSGELLD